jgi:predicted TIM-barrel fold metal-dependent hydrolase
MAEPVIDAHVHLYPDALAAKVTPLLGARFGNEPAFDGTVSGCVRTQAAANVMAALNLPVATDPHQVAHTNDFWREYVPGRAVEQNGVTVFSLAAFHPALPDRIAALEEIRQDGFTGVKFHPEYQSFRFNDAVMDDVWAAMSEWGLVAYLHAGGERVFKPPFHSTPHEILTLHRRFPDLRIVAAHLGGFEMWDEAEELLVGQDVFLDLSHTFFWMPNEQILRMIRRHGAHRVLFGTDAPWQDPGSVREALLALPLTAAERRAILFENANRLFRLGLAG